MSDFMNRVQQNANTDSFSKQHPEVGDEIDINGVAGDGVVVAVQKDRDAKYPNTIVIKWKGYGENPGSRYSGLYSYYPSRTEVYTLSHVDDYERNGEKYETPRYRSLIDWQTRPNKKQQEESTRKASPVTKGNK
jgi:hypothetical protein